MEDWKVIEDFDLYEISNTGRLRSFNNRWGKRDTPIIVKLDKNNKGYFCVKLCSGNNRKKFYIHRLVAQYFCNNPNKHNVVDHIDGDISNNKHTNLRWCSYSQNSQNSKKNINNTSGVKGVYFDTKRKMYCVSYECAEYRTLTRFTTLEEAIVFRTWVVDETFSNEHYIYDR